MAMSLRDLSTIIREGTKADKSMFTILRELLGAKERRTIGHNTDLVRQDDGTIAVVLHWTKILTFRADGTVTLVANGWHSTTTHQRMNLFAPLYGAVTYRVYSKRGDIYVDTLRRNPEPEGEPYWLDVDKASFRDGITVNLETGAITRP